MAFHFFLDLEGDGFGFFGGDDSVAIGEGNWTSCLAGDAVTPEVATDRDPIIFDGEQNGNLGRTEFGWLGNVSVSVV